MKKQMPKANEAYRLRIGVVNYKHKNFIMTVKLEETENRRRLHLGSIFVDLNETDYRELVKIFSDKSRKSGVIKSVCEHLITYVDEDNFQRCQSCDEIVD